RVTRCSLGGYAPFARNAAMTRLLVAAAPHSLAGHSGDRPVPNKSDVRRLLELATGMAPSDALVTALHQAIRGRPNRAAARLRELPATGGGAPPPEQHAFRGEGEYWPIVYESGVLRLRDTKGLRYLARLLGQRGHPLHVTELAGRDPATADRAG